MSDSRPAGTGPAEVVQAAGGALWRQGTGGKVEVAVVHRARYDDWSLPKGKLEPGETYEHAALREVEEETGVRGVLGQELAETRYADRYGRNKLVRWWSMTPTSGQLAGGMEVDQACWLPVADAKSSLSYARDIAVVEELLRVIDSQGSGGG